MAHPLDGARLKVRRAGKHFQELNAEVLRFVEAHPYGFVAEDDPETGLPVVRVRAGRVDEQPPDRLGIIVGDIAHNLRSALDHVVCQLAILNKAPCDQTQFPICNTKAGFGFEAKKRLDGLADRHRAMIRRVQPYHRRKGGVLLAILRDLSNADKHRVVNPATQAVAFVPPTFDPPGVVLRAEAQYKERVRMEDGAEYLRFTEFHARPGATVNMDLEASYNIVFGEWGKYEISARSIGEMRNHVRRLVRRFSGEFP